MQWIDSWLTGRQQRVVLNGEASGWLPVTSGVPQGSVLGPVCFIIFINDLDEVLQLVNGFVYKFADDTKYGRIIRTDADQALMQRDIDRLMEWAERWQMDFNAKKCKIMHIGNQNPHYTYTMGGFAPAGTILTDVTEEKDIGVMVHNSLKPSVQCAKAATTANQVLGQMARSVHYRNKYSWIGLYKSFVRLHLETSVQAWAPWTKTDSDLLEKVQKRAVNMVVGLRSSSYADKLKEVGLTTLADRRVRGDVIQVWKYLHGYTPYNPTMLRPSSSQHTKLTGHTEQPFNLARRNSRLDIRKNFFTVRAVDEWNRVPHSIQRLEDINELKIEYDKFFKR